VQNFNTKGFNIFGYIIIWFSQNIFLSKVYDFRLVDFKGLTVYRNSAFTKKLDKIYEIFYNIDENNIVHIILLQQSEKSLV